MESTAFKVLIYWTSSWTILPKLLLSIIFPITLLIILGRRLLDDKIAVLTWLMFFVGSGYGFLLAEPNERIYHGNWLWSGQIAGFLLFVSHACVLLNLDNKGISLRQWRLIWTSFHLHILAGLIWYFLQFTPDPQRYW